MLCFQNKIFIIFNILDNGRFLPLPGGLTGKGESPISKSPPRTEKTGKRRGGLTAPGQMSRLARLLGNGNVFGTQKDETHDADH